MNNLKTATSPCLAGSVPKVHQYAAPGIDSCNLLSWGLAVFSLCGRQVTKGRHVLLASFNLEMNALTQRCPCYRLNGSGKA